MYPEYSESLYLQQTAEQHKQTLKVVAQPDLVVSSSQYQAGASVGGQGEREGVRSVSYSMRLSRKLMQPLAQCDWLTLTGMNNLSRAKIVFLNCVVAIGDQKKQV